MAQLKKWFMVKLKVKRRLARYAPSIYAKIFYKAYNGKDAVRVDYTTLRFRLSFTSLQSAARSGTGEPLEVSIGMTDGMQDSTEFDMDQAVADLRRASMSTDRRSLVSYRGYPSSGNHGSCSLIPRSPIQALMISRRLIKSSEEIMPSIEHMAGKALFKIQTMGIDVTTFGLSPRRFGIRCHLGCMSVSKWLMIFKEQQMMFMSGSCGEQKSSYSSMLFRRVEELREQQLEAIGEE